MAALFGRFLRDANGATAIEYAFIATLIGVALIVGAGVLGVGLDAAFRSVADGFLPAPAG